MKNLVLLLFHRALSFSSNDGYYLTQGKYASDFYLAGMIDSANFNFCWIKCPIQLFRLDPYDPSP